MSELLEEVLEAQLRQAREEERELEFQRSRVENRLMAARFNVSELERILADVKDRTAR